jgi:hypothetical protein
MQIRQEKRIFVGDFLLFLVGVLKQSQFIFKHWIIKEHYYLF